MDNGFYGKISFANVLKQFEKETYSVNTHSINKIIIDENFDASVKINNTNFFLFEILYRT